MTVLSFSLPDDRYRRMTGFGFGALLGITYGIVYQFGNRMAVPGVPLYQPPYGPVGNVAFFGLGAGVLGLIAAWPRGGIAGTFIAAAVSALALIISAYSSTGARAVANLPVVMVGGIFLVLPFWGMLVPVIGALRWVVSHEEEARRDHQPWHRRVVQPLALLLVVGLVSLTALYPGDARTLIAMTNQMIQAAQGGGSLPAPLISTSFEARGQGAYELSWERERIERYRIPRPGKNFDQHSVVVARFRNGWNLVCLYISVTDPPLCQDMEVIPR